MMKRKQLWIAVAAVCGSLAVGSVSTAVLAADKPMPALTGWNLGNAKTVNGAEPDGRTWIYPSQAARDADVNNDGTGSTGFVIWELDDASGTQPGIQVRTNELVEDWVLRNCIMASGTGKECGDPQSSSKRFKLRVTGSETAPVDLVFNVAGNQPFTYEEGVNPDLITGRIYRVLMKWANFTNARAQGFKVQLGFGTGTEFTPVAENGNDGIQWELDGEVTRASLGKFGGGDPISVWKPEEFATFSPSMYEAGAFFDNVNVAGLFPPQVANPQLIYSGENPSAWALGAITENYFDQWGYMLSEALLPTGIYKDDDGDPATEGSLIAFWDGTNWRYGAPGFTVVPETDLAVWAAAPLSETEVLPGPRYEAAVIDDLAGLNVDVYIRLAETFNATANPTITMRLIPVGPAVGIAGNDANPLWIANPAPDIFADDSSSDSSDGGGCTVGGNGRFDPTLPALAAAGLVFFGLRRFKASK
jgi:hypothetical protein